MYSKYAPIIPYVSIGNILLGANIDETIATLRQDKQVMLYDVSDYQSDSYQVRYRVNNELLIIANPVNRIICILCALEDYQGVLLNGIKLGMTIPEIMGIDNTLIKVEPDDDFVSFENGYFIEHELFDFSDELTTPVTEITLILKDFFPTYTEKDYDNSRLFYSGQWGN